MAVVVDRLRGVAALARDPAIQQRIVDAAEAWAAPFLRNDMSGISIENGAALVT